MKFSCAIIKANIYAGSFVFRILRHRFPVSTVYYWISASLVVITAPWPYPLSLSLTDQGCKERMTTHIAGPSSEWGSCTVCHCWANAGIWSFSTQVIKRNHEWQNSMLWHCCDTSRLTPNWIVLFSICKFYIWISKRFGPVSMHTIHQEPHPEAFKLSGQYWDHPWSGLRLHAKARRQIVSNSSNKQRKAPQISAFWHHQCQQSSQAMNDVAIHPFHTRVGWSMSLHFMCCHRRCSSSSGDRQNQRRNSLEKVIADQQAGTRANGAAEVHLGNFAMLQDRQQQRYLWQDVTWRFSQVSWKICQRSVEAVDALARGFACLLRTVKVV